MVWWILSLCALVGIAYEDLRYRSVHIGWFASLLLGLFLFRMMQGIPVWHIVVDSAWNIGFIAFQLLMLTLYFSIKVGKWTNVFDRYMGWGDVVFLLVCTVYFDFLGYFFFYLLSVFFALLLSIGYIRYSRSKERRTVPLAGLQACFLLVVLLLERVGLWSFDRMTPYFPLST